MEIILLMELIQRVKRYLKEGMRLIGKLASNNTTKIGMITGASK